MKVPVPSDPFVPDRIAFGLTARQVAIVSVAGVVVWVMFMTLSESLSPLGAGLVCTPIAAFGALTVVIAPDGGLMGRFFGRAFTHLVRPRASVLAPQGLRAKRLGVIDIGIKAVNGDGFIELSDGQAALLEATGINLALRTEAERRSTTDSFARLLNSLGGSAQFLVSSSRLDAREVVSRLEEEASYLAHPLLTDSCRDFCGFFKQLVETEGLVRHRMLISLKGSGEKGSQELIRRTDHISTQLRQTGVPVNRLNVHECRRFVIEAVDPEAKQLPIPTSDIPGADR